MSSGIFIISLDFELHWGGFEKWPLENYRPYFLNAREVIPRMLSLFSDYETSVTWATVGLLFHQSKDSMLSAAPALRPSYNIAALSAYNYIQHHGIGNTEEEDPFHFADSLIKEILATPFQELGSHTFAHYYCNEATRRTAPGPSRGRRSAACGARTRAWGTRAAVRGLRARGSRHDGPRFT
jgi:hypothetical protein